jgi:hypothetical protein
MKLAKERLGGCHCRKFCLPFYKMILFIALAVLLIPKRKFYVSLNAGEEGSTP